MNRWQPTLGALAALAVLSTGSAHAAADSWPMRMFDLENSSNVGDDPALTESSVVDLEELELIAVEGEVNATPVITENGLLLVGDGGGSGAYFYVFDLLNDSRRLVQFYTEATVSTPLVGSGIQSTATYATVTVPDGNGGTKEERRVYFGANKKPKSLWCLNLDAIAAERATLVADDGTRFLCDGADWPIIIAGRGQLEPDGTTSPLPVYNTSPIFMKNQEIRVGHDLEVRDVLMTGTIGADCSDGQFWALDAVTAELLWAYDPVPNFQNVIPGEVPEATGNAPAFIGYGGVIWTNPAVSADRKHIYLTTGDCVEQPQVGFQAESLVSLDPVEGTVQWYHQRRLVDTTDYDPGNAPVVVDVPGENGCHHVISTDKNGCIYAFQQEGDIPQVGESGFDPIRPGQQRILWRQCFVPGSLNGGFNASGAVVSGRYAYAQANPLFDFNEDNANEFAVDACTGEVVVASADVGSGRGEGAIASGMLFQPSGSRVQVLRADDSGELLATITLSSSSTAGGGGPAIVNGKIYVPVRSGVSVVGVVDGSGASAPQPGPATVFGGPYPVPIGTGVEGQMAIDPYDPNSPMAGDDDLYELPNMNP